MGIRCQWRGKETKKSLIDINQRVCYNLSMPNWKGGISKDKNHVKDFLKNHLRRIRRATLEALGGKCVRCEFSDFRALQIDHINGGGSQERKTLAFRGTFHKHVLKSFLAKEGKYQLLCANCNWIKRCENKEIGCKKEESTP